MLCYAIHVQYAQYDSRIFCYRSRYNKHVHNKNNVHTTELFTMKKYLPSHVLIEI